MQLENSLILKSHLPEKYKISGISRWIKNYEDFKNKIKRKRWWLDQRYNNIIDLLDKIAETKNCDPILYIHYIYYSKENWVSAENLLKEFKKLWFNNYSNRKSIYALLKNTFNWDLLDSNKIIRNSTKQQINQNPNHINIKRKQIEQIEIEKLYKKIKFSVDSLLLNELNYKKTLNQKIIYILYSLEFIKKENDYELSVFLKEYQKRKIGFLKIAQIIKWIIVKVKPELENEIDEQSLKKRLIERYKKYNS